MPALLEPLAAWLAETAWPAVLGWITTVLWPAIVSALRFLGLTGMVSVLWKYQTTIESASEHRQYLCRVIRYPTSQVVGSFCL